MNSPDILQVMQTLFAATFDRGRGRDSWNSWRNFLRAVFALPMDADALAAYEKHTGRTDHPTEQFREVLAIVGRRGGKSLIAALVAVFISCFRDFAAVLAPGETGVVILLAADRFQARVIFNYVAGFFKTVPQLQKMVKSQTKESIELNNRIRIEIHTSNFRSVRGRTLVCAICDELAFWSSDTMSANPDSEIVAALRPAMATIPNSLLLGISSPYAKRGVLFDGFQRYFGKPGAPVLVWQADTRSMNSTVSQKEIDRAYEQDPASARAEYGAQFRDDVQSFISPEVVDTRIVSGRFELPFVSGTEYAGFVDPSGGSADSFTLAIAHKGDGRAILDLVREVPPPFSPESVVDEFATVLKSYRIHEVVGDRYAGEWPREQFSKRGVMYKCSEKNRSELYLELLPALMSGQVELLDNPKLRNQLVSLERRTARSGRDSVDHSPGSHDDVANAAAGAIVEVLGGEIHLAVVELLKKQIAVTEQPVQPAPTLSCSKCGNSCAKRGPLKRCSMCGFEERVDLVDEREAPRPRAEMFGTDWRTRGLLNLPRR